MSFGKSNDWIYIFVPNTHFFAIRELRVRIFQWTYQYLSHFLNCRYCMAMIQANVGPTNPPLRGRSLMPPGNRSISSTVAYIFFKRAITSGGISLAKSSKLVARFRLQRAL